MSLNTPSIYTYRNEFGTITDLLPEYATATREEKEAAACLAARRGRVVALKTAFRAMRNAGELQEARQLFEQVNY